MLQRLISREIELSAETVEACYRAADYLQMPCISTACATYIKEQILPDAPLDVHAFARDLPAPELQAAVEDHFLHALDWSSASSLIALLCKELPDAKAADLLERFRKVAVSELQRMWEEVSAQVMAALLDPASIKPPTHSWVTAIKLDPPGPPTADPLRVCMEDVCVDGRTYSVLLEWSNRGSSDGAWDVWLHPPLGETLVTDEFKLHCGWFGLGSDRDLVSYVWVPDTQSPELLGLAPNHGYGEYGFVQVWTSRLCEAPHGC
ncbi:hypothetical protein WJX72_009380 [[Myrmecia] bisecta]|uniref:BACK domain-containing protein n=1 Tax=[Myrmecia] bisecta TaxID=41462 RepID=A0AAW1PCJ8_9CHLO